MLKRLSGGPRTSVMVDFGVSSKLRSTKSLRERLAEEVEYKAIGEMNGESDALLWTKDQPLGNTGAMIEVCTRVKSHASCFVDSVVELGPCQ